MRRLIAYISMAFAALLCIGVTANTVFSKMNFGREFTSSREVTYSLESTETTKLTDEKVNEVANEMKARLETMHVEDYSLKIERSTSEEDGEAKIVVALANNDDVQFNYIAKYLSFSGENFSISGQNEETRKDHETVFKDCKAYIRKVNDIYPYVIFPVSNPEEIKNMLKAIKPEEQSQESSGAKVLNRISEVKADDEEEPKAEPDVYLWANWSAEEGDSYEKAQKDQAVTGQKIICSFVSDNIWNTESKEEETELQFLCGFANEEGEYDATKLRQANQMAEYICNVFNASKFDVEVKPAFVTQSASGATINTHDVTATAYNGENLITLGSDVNLRMSSTLIATLIAIGVVSLLLVVFYRLSSIAVITSSITSIYLTYLIIMGMHATFNIAAIIGGLVIALTSIAAGVMYLHKFKEEVYKGRTLRKANHEASKRNIMFDVDLAVISAFSGLMFYVLGGAALRPLGIILFFGSLIQLAVSLILFRIMMYLLTNTTGLQEKLKFFNLEKEAVNNPVNNEVKEEKPHSKINYTKHKKPIGAFMGLLTVASIAGIIVFGILKGSPLNTANAVKDTTSIYTTVLVEGDSQVVKDDETFKAKILPLIKYNDKELSVKKDNGTYMIEEVEYNYETKIETKYYTFVVNLDNEIVAKDSDTYVVVEGQTSVVCQSLDEAFVEAFDYIETGHGSPVSYVKKVSETVDTPNQGWVALATGVAIAGAALYCCLRYRPSRGLSLLLISGATTVSAYGVFVLTRVGTTAVTSLAMPLVAITSIVACILYFNKEKELVKEQRGKPTLAERAEIMVKSLAIIATPMLYFIVVAAYLSINYFGFGLGSFAMLFGSSILGVVLAVICALTLVGPLGSVFEKLFSKIKLPKVFKREKKSKIKLQSKPKTSEPQETIFIGIND